MDGLCSLQANPEITHYLFSHLQYPQRMDGLCSEQMIQVEENTATIACSILSGWTGFAAFRGQRSQTFEFSLAVSSADGRALQPSGERQKAIQARRLAVSSADGRALQQRAFFHA